MNISLIGAGNLATHLGRALHKAGHCICQVYSRTSASAEVLAQKLNSQPIHQLSTLRNDADIYIVALKDDVLHQLLPQLCRHRSTQLFVHTAGSIPMDVFRQFTQTYGVIYPLQTFSKQCAVSFRHIPFLIEGSSETVCNVLNTLCRSISDDVREVSSADRKYIHLAAVFGCNFTNLCYTLAGEILKRRKLPFELLLPLINETAAKVHTMTPVAAQTGPAVRFDEQVMNRQLELLGNDDCLKDIYKMLSRQIHCLSTRP